MNSIVNVIEEGLKGDVRHALVGKRDRAALILTFAGIEAMTYLGLPDGQERVHQPDFEAWCGKYMDFGGHEHPTPADLYGARCGLVHSYTSESSLSHRGGCWHVWYHFRQPHRPPVIPLPTHDPPGVVLAVEALASAFFDGIDRALADIGSSPSRTALALKRFGKMFHLYPEKGEPLS